MHESKRKAESVASIAASVPSFKPATMDTKIVKKLPHSNGKVMEEKESPIAKKGKKASLVMVGLSGKKRITTK